MSVEKQLEYATTNSFPLWVNSVRVNLVGRLWQRSGMPTIWGGGLKGMNVKSANSARRARNDNREGELLESLHDLTGVLKDQQQQKERTFSLKNMSIPLSMLPILVGFLYQGNKILEEYNKKMEENQAKIVERINTIQSNELENEHKTDKRVSSLETTVTRMVESIDKLAATIGARTADRVYRPEVQVFCKRLERVTKADLSCDSFGVAK